MKALKRKVFTLLKDFFGEGTERCQRDLGLLQLMRPVNQKKGKQKKWKLYVGREHARKNVHKVHPMNDP